MSGWVLEEDCPGHYLSQGQLVYLIRRWQSSLEWPLFCSLPLSVKAQEDSWVEKTAVGLRAPRPYLVLNRVG